MPKLITFKVTIEDDGFVSDRRLEKFMTRIEDIFNSRDFDLYDSSWKREDDSDDEENTPRECTNCKGTGLGLTDQTKCIICGGTGKLTQVPTTWRSETEEYLGRR
jgi:DnaJ-class molecular chaperone